MNDAPPPNGNPFPLDPDLQALVNDGTLRLTSESPPGYFEYAIDPFAHRPPSKSQIENRKSQIPVPSPTEPAAAPAGSTSTTG